MSLNQYRELIENDKLHIQHFVYMNNLSSPVKIKAVELVVMDTSGVMEPMTIDATEEFMQAYERRIIELQPQEHPEPEQAIYEEPEQSEPPFELPHPPPLMPLPANVSDKSTDKAPGLFGRMFHR
jgi:hypothetical protein